MKVLTIVGARPQFIKAAAVSRTMANAGVREVLVHTGQHYDDSMSDVFFRELEIRPPDHNLHIGSGSHGAQTGAMLKGLEELMLSERPDWVLVYGDTNSTLAGALAAAKIHIPVAHVEAGLRSFNRAMPEEINRILTDHAADLLFAPTDTAMQNLAAECLGARAVWTGDVMYDAALYYAQRAERKSDFLSRNNLASRGYSLATIHRAANTDDPRILRSILRGLGELSSQMPVVLPLHPRTQAAMRKFGLESGIPAALRIVGPLSYFDMIMAEKHARLIATDSGGVQKEAFFFRVPCVTLREESEWVELIELGCNFLAGTDSTTIVAKAQQALAATPNWETNLYGDGNASSKIVAELASHAVLAATSA